MCIRDRVTISLVDTHGAVLGIVRAPDAPIFGTDVSLQKARTAAFFSGANAGTELSANASADVQHFVPAVRSFLNDPSALTGTFAFADRSGGNLSRPYFPDGEVGRPNGPDVYKRQPSGRTPGSGQDRARRDPGR